MYILYYLPRTNIQYLERERESLSLYSSHLYHTAIHHEVRSSNHIVRPVLLMVSSLVQFRPAARSVLFAHLAAPLVLFAPHVRTWSFIVIELSYDDSKELESSCVPSLIDGFFFSAVSPCHALSSLCPPGRALSSLCPPHACGVLLRIEFFCPRLSSLCPPSRLLFSPPHASGSACPLTHKAHAFCVNPVDCRFMCLILLNCLLSLALFPQFKQLKLKRWRFN
jgi:hypothetical protein